MDQAFSQQSSMSEEQNYVPQGYPAYTSDDDQYGIVYQQAPMQGYGPVVHTGAQPRGLHLFSCKSGVASNI